MKGQLSLDFIVAMIIILISAILLLRFINVANIDARACTVFENRIDQMGSTLNIFSARAWSGNSLNLSYIKWKNLSTIHKTYPIKYVENSYLSAYVIEMGCGKYYPVYGLSINIVDGQIDGVKK